MNDYEKLLYKSNRQKHQLKILQDKCHKYKEVLDKIKEIINNKAFFDPAMPNCNALGQKATLEILKLLEEIE